MKTNCLKSANTCYPADAVEVSPLSSSVFACGTYHLLEAKNETESQRRVGNVTLCRFISSESGLNDFTFLDTTDGPAVFDLKWCHHALHEKEVLGVADTDGDLVLYHLTETSPQKLNLISKVKICDDALACSVDWSTCKHQSNDPSIVVSDSKGYLSVCKADKSGKTTLDQRWKGHEAESWIAAFDYCNPQIVYSGGDDCMFKVWDLRTNPLTCARISKRSEMGFTSIHDNLHQENYVASGSYDEKIYIWDKRNMKRAISVTLVGGGVWNIKWHPVSGKFLLAACMHNGCHILDCQNINEEIHGQTILVSYQEHRSLAYGADWVSTSLKNTDIHGSKFVTCSFYDRRIDLWEINTK